MGWGVSEKDLEQHMKLSFSLRSPACENTDTIKPSEAWHIAPTITNFVRKLLEVGRGWERCERTESTLTKYPRLGMFLLKLPSKRIPSLHQPLTASVSTTTFVCNYKAVHLSSSGTCLILFDIRNQSLNELKIWQLCEILCWNQTAKGSQTLISPSMIAAPSCWNVHNDDDGIDLMVTRGGKSGNCQNHPMSVHV